MVKKVLVTIRKSETSQKVTLQALSEAPSAEIIRSPQHMSCERRGMCSITQLSQPHSKHTSIFIPLSILHVQLLCYGNRQKLTMA